MDAARPRELTTRGAATRNAVLRATMAVLAKEGYSAVTWRRVAAEAGVTGGVLQHHFRDRRALLRAVFEQFSDDLVTHLRTREFDRTQPPTQRVEAFIEAIDSYLTPERNLALLHLTLGLSQEDGPLPQEALFAMLRQQETQWIALFEDTDLARSRVAFRLLHAALQGIAVQRVSVGSLGEPETRALLARVIAAELGTGF